MSDSCGDGKIHADDSDERFDCDSERGRLEARSSCIMGRRRARGKDQGLDGLNSQVPPGPEKPSKRSTTPSISVRLRDFFSLLAAGLLDSPKWVYSIYICIFASQD